MKEDKKLITCRFCDCIPRKSKRILKLLELISRFCEVLHIYMKNKNVNKTKIFASCLKPTVHRITQQVTLSRTSEKNEALRCELPQLPHLVTSD